MSVSQSDEKLSHLGFGLCFCLHPGKVEAQREIGGRLSISLPVIRAGMVMEVKFHNCQIETEEVGRRNKRLWPEEMGAGREGRGGAGGGRGGPSGVNLLLCVCRAK